MRRVLVLTAIFGVFAVGLGCKHVAGRCDCTYDPADAVIAPPSNPYPVVGAPVPGPGHGAAPAVTVPTVPEKMPPVAPGR